MYKPAKISVCIFVLTLVVVLNGCSTDGSGNGEPIEPWVESSCGEDERQYYAALLPDFTREFDIAIAPTTRNMSTAGADLEDAISQATALGDCLHIILQISFGGATANLYDYRRLVDYSLRASMEISLTLDIRSLPQGADFADSYIRNTYLDEVEALISEYPPDFLNLCMEMNAYALEEATKDDYPNLVTLYEEAYDLVKFLSPDTIVYFSHSWELDLWHTLDAPLTMFSDLHDRLDAAGISTFPQLYGIENPAEIPGIYYTDLPQYVDVPIIVECGYSDDSEYGGSEGLARDFPPELIRALGDLNLLLIQLVEMHDLPAEGLDPFFHQMGLRRLDGAAKPIYCGWQYIADSGT